MRILYAVQGTGNGHITRAIELIPHFSKYGDVDILLSGISSDVELPFPVKYRYYGLSFVFGKKGGVDIWKTYWKLKSRKLYKEIKSLPIQEYDLVVSDFEPISSWACKMAGKACIALSNQVATLHPMAPKPKKADFFGRKVLQYYAPSTHEYGFHFQSLDQHIFTPIIRKVVRETPVSNHGYFTVYLPAYSDKKIIKFLSRLEGINWQVFSKIAKETYSVDHITISPIETESFIQSMAGAAGVISNAGFGTTSEALYLGKKLLVIPMKTQYEQQCNASMLEEMGVTVVKKLKKRYLESFQYWIQAGYAVSVDYPDNAAAIVETIVSQHTNEIQDSEIAINKKAFKNIFKQI
jgi:uncharacterized protein (TIGR00661 family)